MQPATRTTLVAAIEHYETQASVLGELMDARNEAIDRYLGRPYGDEVEGRSQVVMRDVADTIEWIKPSLMKVFCSGDEVVKFDPRGPEDVAAAEQETEALNFWLEKAGRFVIFHDWFHDALLQKNGYLVVTWDETSSVQKEQYKGLTDDEFQALAAAEDVEVLEHAAYPGPYGMAHDAVVRQTRKYGCPKPVNVPPERVLVATDWPGLSFDDCPFVEIVEYPTISQLREEGYEVADDIQDDAASSDDEWQTWRRQAELDGEQERAGLEATPEMRRVRVRKVWIRYDSDGDGIAELRRAVVCGSTLLEDEEDDLIPIACITPARLPHEHHGLSIADLVADLQRIRTVLVRGFLDNMYLANAGRNAIDINRIVNIDDLTRSTVGGVVRINGDPSTAIMPLQHGHQGPAILQAIEYVDTVRENRAGVTRYNQGLDANSLNKTASGVNQIMQAAQQRIEMIARLFAETGVKDLMLIMHAVARKHSTQQELIKLRNEWVPIDPRSWKHRRDMSVTVGLGTGNKDQMLAHLMMILQEQKQAMAIGLTRPEQIYTTLSKLTQNAGFKQAEEFWSDPTKFQPPPAPPSPEQIKAQAEMQKMQFSAQQDQMKFQAEQQIEQQRMAMQAELDRNRQEWEARQKSLEAEQQAQVQALQAQYQAQSEAARLEFERWKAELDANVKLQIAGIGQPANEPDQRIDALMGMVQTMAQAMNAPRMIVRDENGRAIGVKPMQH